ncbi:reverse transcriptase domain-containing protein [Tanacetum coccineum]|uniref:Reverse transcriptase domain-containing protein n=1 Tax=Tanacetum coccineum TaxID=301880 RepID=A0ABQ4YBM5_9ASTR
MAKKAASQKRGIGYQLGVDIRPGSHQTITSLRTFPWRAKLLESTRDEMLRLQGLGSNTPDGASHSTSVSIAQHTPPDVLESTTEIGGGSGSGGCEDDEQAAAKTEMMGHATWSVTMFNSTLTGNARVWFDDLLPESIDSYNDLREAFLKNYLQQKKCIRDPIVLHNIKQRDGESTKDFIQRYKSESGNVKGAPECMRISGFIHEITNPELIKRFQEKIPKTVDEMMQVATSFLQGQEAASNQERKKAPQAWRHQEGGHRQNFKKGGASVADIRRRKDKTGRNLEVYVDDLVIKSRTEDEVIRDIETFKTLRKINMKLNPKKCTFGVEEGMFLGYQEAEVAFKQVKEHIAKLPMLIAPEEQEELIIYLAASKEAVSAVLMTEREARQMPIYFDQEYREGQVLAGFIVERPEEEEQDDSAREEEPLPARWTLFTDGSSCETDTEQE